VITGCQPVSLRRPTHQAPASAPPLTGLIVACAWESVLRAHRPLFIAAAVVPLVACAVLALFRDSVANTNAALGLVLVIVAAAATGIRAAGIVAALSSAAWFDFFLTKPYHSFSITDRADIETAVLLVLVGAAVSEVAMWGYRQQARASREQPYLDGVLGTAATVAAGRRSTSSLIDHVCGQIVEVLQIDDCLPLRQRGRASAPHSQHRRAPSSVVAAHSTSNATGCHRLRDRARGPKRRGSIAVLRRQHDHMAISVLSAVEGLKVVEPSLEALIVPITAVIIVALFAFQRMGTAAVGRLFGPVMIAWFLAIAVCGIRGITGHPEILAALSPTYALDFLVGDFSTAFFAVAAVVLAVT
jgi:K+-sensing histidine kinase KdpD